jgi:hypothetical protein
MTKLRGAHLPVWAGVLLLCGLSGTSASADEFDGPSFQRGLWRFERMISNGGGGANLPSATFVSSQVVTRCVDPTNAMRETFKPAAIGNCRSAKPEKTNNRYVFALRCDFMGPARTTIEVESATAYVEINEFLVTKPSKTETIIARRIGDCGDGAPAAVALDTPPAQGFGLSSAESRPVRR